jgi:hypothetical protein
MIVTQISIAHKEVGGRAARLQSLPNRNLNNKDFADTMILNVLHDLHFGQNQPLKSANDQYIRILQNIIKNLGYLSSTPSSSITS